MAVDIKQLFHNDDTYFFIHLEGFVKKKMKINLFD